MASTNAEIERDIVSLTERLRQIRIDKGLPAEPLPRPKVVSIPLSLALIARLAPFKAIVVKYASLLAGGVFVPIDTTKFTTYREDARLLSYSAGDIGCPMYGWAVTGAINLMDRLSAEVEPDLNDAMRRMHFVIGLMDDEEAHSGLVYIERYAYDREHGMGAAEAEKLRLLADPDEMQAAIDDALTKLPKKEDEDLYE